MTITAMGQAGLSITKIATLRKKISPQMKVKVTGAIPMSASSVMATRRFVSLVILIPAE